MKIFMVGAGQVGTTILEALRGEHEFRVVDRDHERLAELVQNYGVTTIEGDGTSRHVLEQGGVGEADLFISCTPRDEANLIACLIARRLAPNAKTIARVSNEEYLEVWRDRFLDVDFLVSSELEAALAVSRIIGIPAARQTDVFADGQVQMVEFEVPRDAVSGAVIGKRLRESAVPYDSRVVSIIREGKRIVPSGGERIEAGDRVVVIGSPKAINLWSAIVAGGEQRTGDVVVFGGGRTGVAIARVLLSQGSRVRIIEADARRADRIAELLPRARVLVATGMNPDFLDREQIGRAEVAVFAMREDTKIHYAATLAKLHGVPFTIAIVHDAVSIEVFEKSGIDVALNPRLITSEEIVRFAHDPRTRQVSMLERDRFEILDVTVREDNELIGKPLSDLPTEGTIIGAIIRGDRAIFPHGHDRIQRGDRVIVFTESEHAGKLEREL
ncbi:MAG: Trk system potassium transporter TrkA [Gaiellaceae bacterium]